MTTCMPESTRLGTRVAERATRRGRADERRVLICVPCLLIGGTEIHTALLASALQACGWRVRVVCYHEFDADTIDGLHGRGVEVELLALDRGMAGAPSLAGALMNCLRRWRPHVVHVQYMAPGALPVITARAAGIARIVATVHVTANHYGRRIWLPRRVAAPTCDAFLCVSQIAEKSFFGTCELFTIPGWQSGRRHFTIHNCVDLPVIDEVLSEKSSEGDSLGTELRNSPVVGIVGRLSRLKGHDILLRAFASLKPVFPEAKLLCIGTGELRDQLRNLAVQLGIEAQVIWAGAVSQKRVFRYLKLMDVVAMPSLPGLEGFGLAAAEAMAMGKPVVASDVDGLAEVVGRDGAGVLVQPGDTRQLSEAIARLLRDSQRRTAIGRLARQRVDQNFSPQTFTIRHRELYQSLHNAR